MVHLVLSLNTPAGPKYVEKFPKYLRNNQFLEGPSMHVLKSFDLSPKEEGLNTKLVTF